MSWFGRKKGSGDDRAAETGVASGLADFLVQATKGRALRQAIDARMLAFREAEADTDAQRGTEGHRGGTGEPGFARLLAASVTETVQRRGR
jgi:hypothetical protein